MVFILHFLNVVYHIYRFADIEPSLYPWNKFHLIVVLLIYCQKFPGGPVVRTWCFHCHGLGLSPSQGTKIPQAAQCGQKIKIVLSLFSDSCTD